MVYGTLFLDIDRTLFDTDAVYRDAMRWGGEPHEQAVRHAADYLYPDTKPFLQAHAQWRRVLLTFGDPDIQQAKVRESGLGELVEQAIYTGSEMKGEVLERYLEAAVFPQPRIFLDDDIQQLQSVQAHAPSVHAVRMVREPTPGVQWNDREVADLDAFAHLVEQV